jgi:two-component system OmpR family response regulator
MSARLLVVEDDHRLRSVLKRGLEAEGYQVEVANNGAQALEAAARQDFSLIVLDRMMPGADGVEICRELRARGSRSLVLMLTARDALQDKIDGLKSGADDYLTKPFALGEALARIEALLRRPLEGARPGGDGVLQVGDLRLDPSARVAVRGKRRIPLTPREYALLEHLMKSPGAVIGRDELLSKVWKLSFDPGTKVLEVHIRFLRRKIDEGEKRPLIRTVRGFGYTISAADD